MKILNLTQHAPTEGQTAEGVFEPTNKKAVQSLLTFVGRPTKGEVLDRVRSLTSIALDHDCDAVMIGGVGFLTTRLELALEVLGLNPVYSFSERVSEEQIQPDGTTKKVNVFRHTGFYPEL